MSQSDVSRFETLPLCDDCWRAIQGDKVPTRIVPPESEVCARCDGMTWSGIYIRARADELRDGMAELPRDSEAQGDA